MGPKGNDFSIKGGTELLEPFCCKISLNWVRLGLCSQQGLEKPPAKARKAPCKGQDSNLSYFMVKKVQICQLLCGEKGADLTKKMQI